MASYIYTVEFNHAETGLAEMSGGVFNSLTKARNWADWLRTKSYAVNVRIMRGGPGGEIVS